GSSFLSIKKSKPGDWRFVYDAKAHRAAFCTLRHPKIGNNINHPNDFGHWLYEQAFEAMKF
ncbi:MAG: hypothetical protein WCT12_16780, partial [Verrucomicrobiota bacterium]